MSGLFPACLCVTGLRWVSTRKTELQCISNGVTSFLHSAIDLISCSLQFSWDVRSLLNLHSEDLGQSFCIASTDINTLAPGLNGCHYSDDILKYILLKEKSFAFDSNFSEVNFKGPIVSKLALVQVMA